MPAASPKFSMRVALGDAWVDSMAERYLLQTEAPSHVEWRPLSACRPIGVADWWQMHHRRAREVCAGCPVLLDCLREIVIIDASIDVSHIKSCATAAGLSGTRRADLQRQVRARS